MLKKIILFKMYSYLRLLLQKNLSINPNKKFIVPCFMLTNRIS